MGIQGSLSFPANPTIRQTYDHGGKTYKWTGTGWRREVPAAVPTFPNGLDLLLNTQINSAAVFDIILPATGKYRAFLFKLSALLPVAAAGAIGFRTSVDGGATFAAAATDYQWGSGGLTSAGAHVSLGGDVAQANIAGTGAVGELAVEGLTGQVLFCNPYRSAQWPLWTHYEWVVDDTGVGRGAWGGAARKTPQAPNALRLVSSSGNIASGNFAMYGYL